MEVLKSIRRWVVLQAYRFMIAGVYINLAQFLYIVMSVKPPMLANIPAWVIVPAVAIIALVFGWFIDHVVKSATQIDKEAYDRSYAWQVFNARLDTIEQKLDELLRREN